MEENGVVTFQAAHAKASSSFVKYLLPSILCIVEAWVEFSQLPRCKGICAFTPMCLTCCCQVRDVHAVQNGRFDFPELWRYLLEQECLFGLDGFQLNRWGTSLLGLKLAEPFRAFNKRINTV